MDFSEDYMKLDHHCNGQVDSNVVQVNSLKIVEPSLKSPFIFPERKVLKSARILRLFKGDLTVVPE